MFHNQLLKLFFLLIFIQIFLLSCSSSEYIQKEESLLETSTGLDPFEQNKLLGRGINFGNALEAPEEGQWGLTLKENYFKLLSEEGFNSIRVPIKWSAHTDKFSPYKINDDFFERIDWIVEMATKYQLAVILNIHHYDEIFEEPKVQKGRFLSIWDQIAVRYKYLPKQFFFETLNEPHSNLTPDIWNEFLADVIRTIRKSNPGRTIIINSAEWGGAGSVPKLIIHEEEKNVIVSFHFYEPFHFTHQGAEWSEDSDAWLGMTWSGTDKEIKFINERMDIVSNWVTENNRPINIGEFGCYSKADMESRIAWTTHIAQVQASKRGFTTTYWEFGSGFGIYDPDEDVWRYGLLKALIP